MDMAAPGKMAGAVAKQNQDQSGNVSDIFKKDQLLSLKACARTVSMKRGRAEEILKDVQNAVLVVLQL